MRRAFVIASLVGSTVLLACGGPAAPRQPDEQLAFGVAMAREGLWSEAYFRFEQAVRLGADDAGAWNNMAVAAEALGRFDEALEHYQKALRLDPNNGDLRNNYDRFQSFYESYRARSEDDGDGETSGGEASAEGSAEPTDEGGAR